MWYFFLTTYYSIVKNNIVMPYYHSFTSILPLLGQLGNRAALTFFSNSLSFGIDFPVLKPIFFALKTLLDSLRTSHSGFLC